MLPKKLGVVFWCALNKPRQKRQKQTDRPPPAAAPAGDASGADYVLDLLLMPPPGPSSAAPQSAEIAIPCETVDMFR